MLSVVFEKYSSTQTNNKLSYWRQKHGEHCATMVTTSLVNAGHAIINRPIIEIYCFPLLTHATGGLTTYTTLTYVEILSTMLFLVFSWWDTVKCVIHGLGGQNSLFFTYLCDHHNVGDYLLYVLQNRAEAVHESRSLTVHWEHKLIDNYRGLSIHMF